MENILEVKNLHTYFYKENAVIKAVEGVNLSMREGEVLGLVGESACGKSVSAYSVMRLIQPPGKIEQGEVIFEGKNLLKISENDMRAVRGGRISMIFQEPQAALNPLYTIGFQIEEVIKFHRKEVKGKRHLLVCDLLEKVGIANPKMMAQEYPHRLSGGQAQRAVIAMALACNPGLLIADEPTTSLDVTIQAQVMNLFMQLKQETKFTLILITHNLALCSQLADSIAIMYAGRIVEKASKRDIFEHPLHPYTKALFSSIPHGACGKKKLNVIEGVVPDPAQKPSGCHFHPRCQMKKDCCVKEYPQYREITPDHWVSCHLA